MLHMSQVRGKCDPLITSGAMYTWARPNAREKQHESKLGVSHGSSSLPLLMIIAFGGERAKKRRGEASIPNEFNAGHEKLTRTSQETI